MRYTVTLERGPQRALDALRGDTFRRIVEALHALEDNPRPPGVKKLSGRQNCWRVRVGDYRILYTIRDDRLIVLVLRIGHRRDVYA